MLVGFWTSFFFFFLDLNGLKNAYVNVSSLDYNIFKIYEIK